MWRLYIKVSNVERCSQILVGEFLRYSYYLFIINFMLLQFSLLDSAPRKVLIFKQNSLQQ